MELFKIDTDKYPTEDMMLNYIKSQLDDDYLEAFLVVDDFNPSSQDGVIYGNVYWYKIKNFYEKPPLILNKKLFNLKSIINVPLQKKLSLDIPYEDNNNVYGKYGYKFFITILDNEFSERCPDGFFNKFYTQQEITYFGTKYEYYNELHSGFLGFNVDNELHFDGPGNYDVWRNYDGSLTYYKLERCVKMLKNIYLTNEIEYNPWY